MSLRTHADIVAAAAPIIGFAPTNSIVAYMAPKSRSCQEVQSRPAV